MANMNSETGTIYSRAELTDAFNRVEDKTNWKNPIDTIITVGKNVDDELHVIGESVVFFTGCRPTYTKLTATTCRVKAAGYYATIGA
jgi:hypothetical protein